MIHNSNVYSSGQAAPFLKTVYEKVFFSITFLRTFCDYKTFEGAE
jgi:hypothetical protein